MEDDLEGSPLTVAADMGRVKEGREARKSDTGFQQQLPLSPHIPINHPVTVCEAARCHLKESGLPVLVRTAEPHVEGL